MNAAIPIDEPDVVLVCHDCRLRLLGLGATVAGSEAGPLSIALGHSCETHPTPLPIQASHAMHARPSVVRQLRVAGALTSNLALAPRDDLERVSELAAHLLSGRPDATDADIFCAVSTARRIRELAGKD